MHQTEEGWGAKVIERLAKDLYCRHLIFSTPSPVYLRKTGVFLAGSTEKLKWDGYTHDLSRYEGIFAHQPALYAHLWEA